jgi:hypothetical protein
VNIQPDVAGTAARNASGQTTLSTAALSAGAHSTTAAYKLAGFVPFLTAYTDKEVWSQLPMILATGQRSHF